MSSRLVPLCAVMLCSTLDWGSCQPTRMLLARRKPARLPVTSCLDPTAATVFFILTHVARRPLLGAVWSSCRCTLAATCAERTLPMIW